MKHIKTVGIDTPLTSEQKELQGKIAGEVKALFAKYELGIGVFIVQSKDKKFEFTVVAEENDEHGECHLADLIDGAIHKNWKLKLIFEHMGKHKLSELLEEVDDQLAFSTGKAAKA